MIETMLRGVMRYAQAQKIKVSDPDVPLVVVMFRTEAQFQAYQEMPPGVAAYYDPMTNRVFLHEENLLSRIDRALGVRHSLSTIAHEGAHQILHNIGVQKRLSRWPMWLSEGLAEFFAPTSFGDGYRWKGAGEINDMRMFELENFLKVKTDGVNGLMVNATVGAGRLTSTGYASAWSLTRFLAKSKRVEFNRLVKELSSLQPFEGYVPDQSGPLVQGNVEIFQEFFDEDFIELETRLVNHLRRQPYVSPFAEFPHYVASISFLSGKKKLREAKSFFSSRQAEQWKKSRMAQLIKGGAKEVQAATAKFDNRNLAERYIRRWSGR